MGRVIHAAFDALVTTILLRMAGLDAFDGDTEVNVESESWLWQRRLHGLPRTSPQGSLFPVARVVMYEKASERSAIRT